MDYTFFAQYYKCSNKCFIPCIVYLFLSCTVPTFGCAHIHKVCFHFRHASLMHNIQVVERSIIQLSLVMAKQETNLISSIFISHVSPISLPTKLNCTSLLCLNFNLLKLTILQNFCIFS